MFHDQVVAVVIPAYNEARLLPRTLATLPSFVDLVVVVDDASRDETPRVAQNAEPRVVLVRHASNRGVGAAIATGYGVALARGAELIAVMAADAQMDPQDLPALLAPVARGEADYAKGDRMAHPEVARVMPWWRYLGGRALSWLTRLSSGYSGLRDSQCGYTVIRRDTLASLPIERLYPRYGYPNDLLAWLNVLGSRVAQVTVRPIYGDETSGIHPLGIVPRLILVLARSWALRMWHKHLRRGLLSPRPAPGVVER